MNIKDIINVCMALNLNFSINHTNDYSEMIVPSNNDFNDCVILFNCYDGKVYDISTNEEEDEENS